MGKSKTRTVGAGTAAGIGALVAVIAIAGFLLWQASSSNAIDDSTWCKRVVAQNAAGIDPFAGLSHDELIAAQRRIAKCIEKAGG